MQQVYCATIKLRGNQLEKIIKSLIKENKLDKNHIVQENDILRIYLKASEDDTGIGEIENQVYYITKGGEYGTCSSIEKVYKE